MSRRFRFFVLFPLFALALSLTPACSKGGKKAAAAPAAPGFHTVTPAEAMRLIKTRKDLFILDVRNPQELKEGRIAGSTLVPLFQLRSFRPDPDRPILVYCAVGGRSYLAGQYLYRNGVKEVYNIQGGIAAWKRAGLPVVR